MLDTDPSDFLNITFLLLSDSVQWSHETQFGAGQQHGSNISDTCPPVAPK